MNPTTPVALVTGASRGLGAVIAGVLAARGHDLVIGARQADALEHAAGQLSRLGRTVIPIAGDVADAATRARYLEAAGRLGGLDVLVNNASELGPIGPLMACDGARLERLFAVNVGAPTILAQLAVPLLSARRGVIVNITSDAALGAYPGWAPYGATKAALDLVTRTLAAELAAQGVSAVLVDPGDMRTRMQQDAFPHDDISDRPLPEVTAPFWHWLFAQDPARVRGGRWLAQQEATWLQPV